MATYKGNDLIISDGSSALAASKSCTLTVEAEEIETSSPTQGSWRNYIAGIKGWSVTTNHLVKAGDSAATPLKDMIARVGKKYTLTFTVTGFASDTVSGTALCRNFKVTATRGSLLQGSFTWTGDGALE